MKFVKEFPKNDGYYYYIDVAYPIPMIGFMYQRPNGNFVQPAGNEAFMLGEMWDHYRFGPLVPMPECKDIHFESTPQ